MTQGKAKITKEDRAWAKLIKDKFNNKCIICGSSEKLNAHHLIPREIKKFKYDLDNGVALCPKHHRFSFELSAHQNPIAFIMWLEKNHPELLKIIKKKIKI
jgi:hypothetical protein